jgi:hypothetical protein
LKIVAFIFVAMFSVHGFAKAECLQEKAFSIFEKSLPKKPNQEVETQKQQSAEGGIFNIYWNSNKKPERIARVDYGETGRSIVTLAIGSPNDLMITSTFELYNAHIAMGGGITVHSESDYYYFCDGKLLAAPDADPQGEYAKAARIAADTFFKAPEIAQQIKQSKAIAPQWP